MTGNHRRRVAVEAFWKSKKGRALKKRLHAGRDKKGRFTKKGDRA